jgi:hypothetical protein
MKHEVYFHGIEIKRYTVMLNEGEEIPVDGKKVPYDYGLRLSTYIPRHSLGVRIPHGGGAASHIYADETDLLVGVMIFFSDSRNSPRNPRIEIAGRIHSDTFRMVVTAYKSTKHFANFVDILRNESPLFLHLVLEIDQSESRYLADETTLLPNNEIRIKGTGSFTLSTTDEEVGEGESQAAPGGGQ